jgi:hypothetical protein
MKITEEMKKEALEDIRRNTTVSEGYTRQWFTVQMLPETKATVQELLQPSTQPDTIPQLLEGTSLADMGAGVQDTVTTPNEQIIGIWPYKGYSVDHWYCEATRLTNAQPDTVTISREVVDYVHTSKLKEAFGMFLNGMAYYETFPDDAEDARQLQKSATYNFLRARNHIGDELADICSACCKAVYTTEYEKALLNAEWNV